MDFGFNQEQELLRATARKFFENECKSEFVRARMAEPAGVTDEFWKKLGEQRREEGPRHHGAAHLFHEHGEVDEAEAGAAELFRIHETEPPLLAQLLPELIGHARRLRHARAHQLALA